MSEQPRMSEQDRRPEMWRTGGPINSGEVTVVRYICIATPGGVRTIHLDPADERTARYRADPDQFAADEVGLSKDEYREWVALDGMALCGERTKSGALCKNLISRIQLSAKDWKARHRQGACHSHGGN
jgi:hypothetical protein